MPLCFRVGLCASEQYREQSKNSQYNHKLEQGEPARVKRPHFHLSVGYKQDVTGLLLNSSVFCRRGNAEQVFLGADENLSVRNGGGGLDRFPLLLTVPPRGRCPGWALVVNRRRHALALNGAEGVAMRPNRILLMSSIGGSGTGITRHVRHLGIDGVGNGVASTPRKMSAE